MILTPLVIRKPASRLVCQKPGYDFEQEIGDWNGEVTVIGMDLKVLAVMEGNTAELS